jgi:hypothetical protein
MAFLGGWRPPSGISRRLAASWRRPEKRDPHFLGPQKMRSAFFGVPKNAIRVFGGPDKRGSHFDSTILVVLLANI